MIQIWKLKDDGSFFSSEQVAKEAAAALSSDWGRAYGGPFRTVSRIQVFESVKEWLEYTGMGNAAGATRWKEAP